MFLLVLFICFNIVAGVTGTGCPDVTDGTCTACSAGACTAVTCDAFKFNTNGNAADGCEVGCPGVTDGTCDTSSDKDTCITVTCDTGYVNFDGNVTNGCEAGCPVITGGTCTACTESYFLYKGNSGGCRSGGVYATECDDCEQWADCKSYGLGLGYNVLGGLATWSTDPPGCFLYKSHGIKKVYFNLGNTDVPCFGGEHFGCICTGTCAQPFTLDECAIAPIVGPDNPPCFPFLECPSFVYMGQGLLA